ncbi:MAG TPA: aconitate hydratase [Bacillota bacterium]|jgi:aconitate hydratase|nr:aconitate hydratase [Bacillota bacterium]HOA35035.1 aconitate hydratase [Bacillota bacterium]HOJ83689.1 aconitate hydratase [Bacillota bacterium]HPZ10946.1 aconitate hydratase [Bacillota bacterium]HQE09112.1 aconitate hydratase [Bacillota bacterium]
MADNLTAKILKAHLLSGKLRKGEEIAIRIDQTLTQDATGTMAYLQFEALGMDQVRTELSVSYVDHNTLQGSFENADDHRYLQSVAARYGIYFSRPGNGICHQVHLERFGVPGKTLLGSDSHTPTGGGLGMLAIGAGGLDVAVAMAGGPFYLNMPEVLRVNLVGELPPWTGAKDIILELLRRLTVKGGVGRIIEYGGPGVKELTVPERATITNMGAELGATTSIFPSDEVTRRFLQSQGRRESWIELQADPGASYDGDITIELDKLEPLAACPHSPDAVRPIREIDSIPVDQVVIGSCTNSSFEDLRLVAEILDGKTVHPRVSLAIAPGSRQVLLMLARSGALEKLIAAGARILESACGPCIGMGQAPPSGGVSLRTFNRNFRGRCGTADASVYLAGPEAAAASALYGRITDPRELGEFPELPPAPSPIIDDRMIISPPADGSGVEIIRGPNIKPLPLNSPPPDKLTMTVLLKTGDNITTDQIMPAGTKILPLRSNIPAMSEYVFAPLDESFARRAREAGSGIVVGGENYGQGSSREHAALAPMYLGIKAVLAKSFARIHHTNLVNFGIIPLVFESPTDYDRLQQDDILEIDRLQEQLERGGVTIANRTQGYTFKARHELSQRQVRIIMAGGLLMEVRGQK